MDGPLAHFLRRHRRFAVPLHANPIAEHLGKRLTPEQLASIQSEMSVSAMRASTAAQRPISATSRPGANAATVSTTIRSSVSTFSAAPSFTVGQPIAVTPSTTSSSTVPLSSSSTSSSLSSSAVTTSPRVLSTSSSTTSTLSTTSEVPTTTSTLPQVITRTQAAPVTSISNSLPTVASEQSNQSSTSSSLSTGAVVGIVLAVLVGVVILGSLLGWVYRKFAARGYKSDSRWRKLDEDITPFPQEKDGQEYNDDFYGGASAPVIGSRRALADQANRDGGYPASRPMSEYQSNRAGLGSGGEGYGASDLTAYPAHLGAATYGVDAQGRPYNAQAGRVPSQIPYYDDYGYPNDKPTQAPSSPPNSRQLAGPQLVPVPLGRPAPPRSYSDIASREDFADEPTSAGLPYAEPDSYAYQPSTARTNEWAGSAQAYPVALPMAMPMGHAQPVQTRRISGQMSDGSLSPSPPSLAPMPLPTFAPLSPLSSSFELTSHAQPLAMYENEPARQKQLYSEVAAAAGFAEPKTPHSAGLTLNDSLRSNDTFGTGTTHSSFSATEHGVRLPVPLTPVPAPPPPLVPRALPQISPPKPHALQHAPYEHGRPLSPLVEVATPSTIKSVLPAQFGALPLPSSSIGHGGAREMNPFDRMAMPASGSQRTLVAPHSAGANSFASARYPPPSPGGMSVPGSVTDSPRRWSGHDRNANMARRSRGESMFDGEDAYGGI